MSAGPAALAVSASIVVGYAWVATGLRPFTLPSLVATVGAGLAAIAAGRRLPPAGPPVDREQRRGEPVWAGLAAATIVWELQSFLQHPRRDHPTLSSLTNDLLQTHPARALAMVAWLAAGVWLARR